MLEIVREINLANPREMNDPYHLLALAEQIKNAPFERYVPQQLAKDMGLSYVHFRTLFKEVHGDTIHQFILKQQMQTAGELLKKRSVPDRRTGRLLPFSRPAVFYPCIQTVLQGLTETMAGKKSGQVKIGEPVVVPRL